MSDTYYIETKHVSKEKTWNTSFIVSNKTYNKILKILLKESE